MGITGPSLLRTGAPESASLRSRLEEDLATLRASGHLPPPAPDAARQPERLAIVAADGAGLLERGGEALRAFASGDWTGLDRRGVFRGSSGPGHRPRVAFLFPGQGSQSLHMLGPLRAASDIVGATFDEADAALGAAPGSPRWLDRVFPKTPDADAERAFAEPAVFQPAILAADLALVRLLAQHGVTPDFAMGHSLGEYAALVAAGCLDFADALRVVSTRDRELASVRLPDPGRLASVLAPLELVEQVLAGIDGYVVCANYNCRMQTVIGGETAAVERAVGAFRELGAKAMLLPVSHAFHTSVVSPACEPLRQTLARLRLRPARFPLISNVTGEPYPAGEDAPALMLDLLARQVAAPVRFSRGLHSLRSLGATVFVETGARHALCSAAVNELADDPDIRIIGCQHARRDSLETFAEALGALFAAGAVR